jgi:hypothetical protein
MRDGEDELSDHIANKSSSKSISLDGMIALKDRKVQTLNAYELTTELVYNQVETKVRDLVRELVEPLDAKQTKTFK